MSRSLRILPEAERELSEAAAWYEERRTGFGVEFLATIDQHLDRVAANPEGYPRWREDRRYHRCTVQRFPYLLFFTLEADEVEVVAVAHSRRRPGYWRDRAPD